MDATPIVTGQQKTSRSWHAQVAWALCVLSVVLFVATLALALLNRHAGQMWRVVDPVFIVGVPIYAVVGALIAARRPGNLIGWSFVAIGLLSAVTAISGAWAVYGLQTRAGGAPGAAQALWVCLWFSGAALLAPIFPLLYFPTGRLLDRRARVIAWALAASIVALAVSLSMSNFVPPGFSTLYERTPNPWAWRQPVIPPVVFIQTAGLCGLAAVALLLQRLRRSSGVERQQFKWIVFAMAFVVATYVGDFVARSVFSGLIVISGPASSASIAVVPLTVGIAILRHQLFDIDRVINRALVYASLTAALIGSYALGVVLLQRLLDPLTRGSDLAVAGTTLLVAAAARPARGWIQRAVDRRFYRSRYDAERTLDAFAMRLREQIELDGLAAELREVVHETMQPAHVSLWLRTPPN